MPEGFAVLDTRDLFFFIQLRMMTIRCWLLGGILALMAVPLCAQETAQVPKRGLTYWGSDPYAALQVAKRERKLLLVEFYADWNHRSRWMSERVLGDSAVRAMIEATFVAVQVPTGTQDGAALAQAYEVTDYPAIVIFSSNGDVLDKVDVTLDAEDFGQRLRTVLMAVQGAGTWRLSQVYTAAERSDVPAVDAAMGEFLRGQLPQDVANGVVWPVFENSMVMRYGSTAFNYLVANVALFRREVGRETVDGALSGALWRSMLPYVVGSVPFAADVTDGMVAAAEQLQLPEALALRSMADVAGLRADEDLSLLVGRLGLLMDQVPESYQLPLALSLEVVAQRGTREARTAALKIVNRVFVAMQSQTNAAMLDALRDRLK